jgi:two-component system OmpR family response regulator
MTYTRLAITPMSSDEQFPAERARILVVEDDAETACLLARFLRVHGYDVMVAPDGQVAGGLIQSRPFDLILLDIMLPGENGLELCRRYAAQGTRIIMVTALSETSDRIVGLDYGADDYVAKPFDLDELAARVRAVLRRAPAGAPALRPLTDTPLVFAEWQFYPTRRYLRSPDGIRVPLTGAETDLLLTFCQHPQQILSREQLLAWTRGDVAVSPDRAIDLLVSRLRRKLSVRGMPSDAIQTARAGGYLLRHPVSVS